MVPRGGVLLERDCEAATADTGRNGYGGLWGCAAGAQNLGFTQGLAETILALALALGIMPRLSVAIAALLLWFFALLIGRSLGTGERFACFCFGDAESQLSRATLLRTAALALLASLLALVPTPQDVSPGLSVVSLLDAIASGALLATIVLISYIPRLVRWNRDPIPASTTSSSGGD